MAWLMKTGEKQRILDLAIRQSKAYGALKAAEKKASPEELAKLKAAEAEALENLRKEAMPVLTSADHVKELALHVRQEALARPIRPKQVDGKWEQRWDKQVARDYKNALNSLRSALVAELGSEEKAQDDPRVKVLMPRARSVSLLVQLFNALDGETPDPKGQVDGTVKFGLRRLNSKIGVLVKANRTDEANRLITVCQAVERGFSNLLKEKPDLAAKAGFRSPDADVETEPNPAPSSNQEQREAATLGATARIVRSEPTPASGKGKPRAKKPTKRKK